MENNDRGQLKHNQENLKLNIQLKSPKDNAPVKQKLIITNIIDLSVQKNYKNDLYANNALELKLNKIFNILKQKMSQNRYIFEKFKFYINSKYINNKNIRNNLLPFELKKEIFLDKFKTNIIKEEYYNKCNIINNKGIDNNLKNKLIKYISKTHNILLDNHLTTKHKKYNYNLNNNFNNNRNEYKNKSQIQTNNISRINNLNNNLVIRNTTPNFYINSIKIKIPKTKTKNKTKKSNYKILASVNGKYNKKRISCNLKNANNLNIFQSRIDNEEKKLISTFSPYNSGKFIPLINNIDDNIEQNNLHNMYYKNINNIFLSELPEDLKNYQSDTYNPKNNSHLYSNFLNYNFYTNKILNNNKNINITERKIYKKYNSFNSQKKNIYSTNEVNKGKFKEIIINYNNKSNQISFDGLKKDLKEEFNKNINKNNKELYIIKERYEKQYNENNKNKLNKNKLSKNKYITYNNIINNNESYIVQNFPDENYEYNNYTMKNNYLSKNMENNTSKIQSYVISFNKHDSNKNPLRNNRDNIVYHRPKSSSKFKKFYKNANYSSNDFNIIYNNNLVEFNDINN